MAADLQSPGMLHFWAVVFITTHVFKYCNQQGALQPVIYLFCSIEGTRLSCPRRHQDFPAETKITVYSQFKEEDLQTVRWMLKQVSMRLFFQEGAEHAHR